MPKHFRFVLRAQAFYYIASGMWPLVSRRSFEAVTGPKTDWWLVQMVGLLAVTNGIALAAATHDRVTAQTRVLSAFSALSFAGIDLIYVARRRVRTVYLADAAFEMLVLLGWGVLIRP